MSQPSVDESLVSEGGAQAEPETDKTLDTIQRRRAAAAYARSRAIMARGEAHAPFQFDELATSPQQREERTSSSGSPPAAQVQKRRGGRPIYYKPTRFFPGGEADNQRVDAVASVRGARLQRILPSYELSTAETRESGEGPALEFVERPPQRRRRDKSE
ncbi:MAG: hypothetical protein VYD19_08530 [Myxococcota bacterium]|nr:hypothetical protein [Myxococcota bacterium]